MKTCSTAWADACGAAHQCPRPVAYRCVVSWTPLVDTHVCALHRPDDESRWRAVIFLGDWDVSGTVVSLEALRERRKMRLQK